MAQANKQQQFQRVIPSVSTDAKHKLYTGIEGELTFVRDTKHLYVHDGTTVGGINVMGDPMLEIAKGNIPGHGQMNKFGRNATVANGEEIWDGSAVYVYPATALMTSISQTADQAAMRGQTVSITGLDASWDEVTQTATLDASDTTTVVTLTTALIRCYRVQVTANVVTDQDIRVHNAGETQDYAIVMAGNNQTLMAVYTVPNGKTAYMTSMYATSNPQGGAPTTLDVLLWARDNDNSYEKQLKHTMAVSGDLDAYGQFQHFFRPYVKYTQKTDIFVTGSVSGAADISAGFDLIVVDN